MSKDKAEVKRGFEPGKDEFVVGYPDNDLITVLASSTEDEKNAAAIEKLLNSGADINAVNENGNTPLHMAIQNLQIETVKLLLKRGANLETANFAGITPLQMAAFTEGSSFIFRLLLEKGANLYTVDQKGNTVLHAAAAIGNILVIEKIIAENPRFHKIKNHLGDTPLHVATSCRCNNSIDKLIMLGADPQARNKLGQDPSPPRNAVDLDENEADKKQAKILQILEIPQQSFEWLKPPSVPVSSASLKDVEERLLAERSYNEAFTDWVHENPVWAFLLCLLIVPIFHVVEAAYSSNNSKKSIKNFVDEFAVAVINGDLSTTTNAALEQTLIALLNEKIKMIARQETQQSLQSQTDFMNEQKNQIKEIFLNILNDAPSVFPLSREELASLLEVKEENGEIFIVFKNGSYLFYKNEKYEHTAEIFQTLTKLAFNIDVNVDEQDVFNEGIKGKFFTCLINIRDICNTPNQKALHNYYAAFEVRAVIKEAIEYWAKQNEANTPLAKSIIAGLKVHVGGGQKAGVYSEAIDKDKANFNDVLYDTDESALEANSNEVIKQAKKQAKEEELSKKSADYKHLINDLTLHLTNRFGKNTFKLTDEFNYKVNKDRFNFQQNTTLTVSQREFQSILERKREETHSKSEIFPPVFLPGQQLRQNAYLPEEHEQIKQFAALLKSIFIRSHYFNSLESISLKPVNKNNVEYFEVYSINDRSINFSILTPSAIPYNLVASMQALVNQYFLQPDDEVLDLVRDRVFEGSEAIQFKLLVRKDRLNHLLKWSKKKEEAEKVRDALNDEFHRNFRLETIKNDEQYSDGTLFLTERIEEKDEDNSIRLAVKAASKVNASLSDRRSEPEQFVKAESRDYGDSHQVFVSIYPDKLPGILDIMQANDRNLSPN